MKHVLLLAVALVGLAAQQPPDESNVPEAEKRIPPFHYCKRVGVTIGPKETRAHSCDCKYSCTVNAQGEIVEHESPGCLSYCHVNGRKCTCHVEEACPDGHHNALMDMDGRVVSVQRIR